MNSFENIAINQSPKISSGKFRNYLENKNSFSLLDVNEKVTNDRGPSLPIQFKRLSSKEVKKLFKTNLYDMYKKMKVLKHSSMKNILFEKMKLSNPKINTNDQKKNFKNKKKYETENKEEISKNTQRKTFHKSNTFSGEEIKKIQNQKGCFVKRPQTCKIRRNKINFRKIGGITEERKDSEKTYIKRDIWKPLYYETYEEMVKDKKFFIKKLQENPFFKKLPQCSIKEIKAKTHNSDIFCVKKDIEKNNLEKKRKERHEKYNNYFDSDIFNLKNNEVSINKIGEKYLFNSPTNLKYTSSRESKSDWQNNITKETMGGCSSKEYNILTPNRKNNYFTKDDIYKILDDKTVLQNPLHKQKGISKYIDSANNSSSNFGKEYLRFYNSNPNCFKKVMEHCGTYGDLYLQYKNLVDEPFYKKTTLNNKE
jgi:galactitol-specific phosphotransferase system IIB component